MVRALDKADAICWRFQVLYNIGMIPFLPLLFIPTLARFNLKLHHIICIYSNYITLYVTAFSKNVVES